MKYGCGMVSRLIALLIMSVIGLPAMSIESNDSVIPGAGDDGFISCSMLTVSPGAEIYQTFGHALIRMECPSAGLDFVFTFETDGDRSVLDNFFSGSEGMVVAVETDRFLRDIAGEGRGVSSFALNLSPSQKQKLWRELDGLIARPSVNFNLRQQNCMSEMLSAVGKAIYPDTIDIGSPQLRHINNAAMMDYMMAVHRPWAALAYKIGTGAQCDDVDSWLTRTTPALFDEIYRDARIVSPDGRTRPLVAGDRKILVEPVSDFGDRSMRPPTAAWIFALFVVVLCVADLTGRCRVAVRVADGALLALQTVGALALMLLALSPYGIGHGWNWYLIVFNPIPALLWLVARGSKRPGALYLCYSLVLAVFVLVVPSLTSEVDITGIIVVSALAVRCAVKYGISKAGSKK